jgi:hypothetical protein
MDVCNDAGEPLGPAASISIDPGMVAYLPLMELPSGHYAIVTGIDPCTGSIAVEIDQIAMLDVTE